MSGIGTFVVVFYTSLGVGLALILLYLLRRTRWRWLLVVPTLVAVALLAAAPWVEEARIASQFNDLCKNAGIHVTRKVVADGYLDDIGWRPITVGVVTSADAIKELDRTRFRYIEYRGYGNDPKAPIGHVEKLGDAWQVSIIAAPTARFHLRESQAHKLVGHRVSVLERVVVDSETNEILGRDTVYKRRANTIDEMWAGAFGSTLSTCPELGKGGPRPALLEQVISPPSG